jgi:hypothetical protein
MDILKKHYEKILLAVALVALIVSAVLLALRINALSSNMDQAPNPVDKVAPASHAVLGAYSNAIARLAQPPLWTNVTAELFTPIPIGPVFTNTNPSALSNEFPVILMSAGRKPFKLLFKAYNYDATANEGYSFQINFQFRARTFFISRVGDPIKDRYEDTGYRIVKFEKKSVNVIDPSLGGSREKDVSELTVQREGGKPKTLVYSQEAVDEEPVALVRCGAEGQNFERRIGQSIECRRKVYKVVDIVVDSDPKRMVIVDTQTQEQHIIKSQQ